MKLTDIKKNADAKAAEVEAARKHAQQMKELEVHPLLKWGCDRSVRDTYFCGVVFAALSDDVKVDTHERKVLTRIGRSLILPDAEIEEAIAAVAKVVRNFINAVNPETGEGGDKVFSLLEECAGFLTDEKVFRLFVAEYVKVCSAKGRNAEVEKDVSSQLADHVCPRVGYGIDKKRYSEIWSLFDGDDAVRVGLLNGLAGWIGDDAVRYYMRDVADVDIARLLQSERRRLSRIANVKAREQEHCQRQKRFEDKLDRVAATYRDCSAVTNDMVDDIADMLAEVPPDVDVAEGIVRICNGIMQGNDYFRSRKGDRQRIWRLIGVVVHLYGANYIHHHTFSPSLNRLVQVCGQDAIRKTVEKFVNAYLSNFCTIE